MDLTMQRLLLRANPWLANPDARVSLMERHLPENYLHRRIEGEIARRIATEGRAILVTGPGGEGLRDASTRIVRFCKELHRGLPAA